MAGQNPRSKPRPEHNRAGITRITVAGFKSISQEQSIEIRPLTILAGANSSGKSSIMQPLLLLKQTLEATYDPGALLLNGPNVRFTSVDQLFSLANQGKSVNTFSIGIEVVEDPMRTLRTYFTRSKSKRLDVARTTGGIGKEEFDLRSGMSQDKILSALPATTKNLMSIIGLFPHDFILTRNRCFLSLTIRHENGTTLPLMLYNEGIVEYIRQMLHLPGLRGNPQRTYPVTAVGSKFPGTFENYVASVIGQWQTDGDNEKLAKVNHDLARLGLTGKVVAKSIDDTQVELLVNRFRHSNNGSAEDMVSIADVGFGVSQALPVVIALHAANQGQLVYLEQPEIHLHPRAQYAMAEVLADAALQGRRLVVETHSNLLLRGVQTLVAEGKLPPEMVKLHWFKLLDDGSTHISSADLDKTGAFGDWPEDFDTVTLDSEGRYLDAAEARLRGK